MSSLTLRHLSALDIDANSYIPKYFDDFLTLAWLAFLLPNQTKEPAPSLKELEELSEDDIIEISANQFTPRKRRAIKIKEELDDKFLRRSKRNAAKLGGFKSPLKPSSKADAMEPVPLQPAPAPYLTQEIVEGIATGFLQIHPSDVSAAVLKKDINDN